MSIILRRLAYLLRRRRAESELAEELDFHREMAQRDLQRSGVPEEEAAHAVGRTMGSMALALEDARELWSYPWLESVWQDLRYGLRSLARSPGLVVVSALSLGLGIGINAMLFMAASTVYRHQPTMANPREMVGVEPVNANQFSYPDYQDLLGAGIFADVVGFRTAGVNLRLRDAVMPLGGLAVTANFFEALGVRARLGRTFTATEAAPAQEPRVVVITHGFWQRRLGAAADVIGEALILNGQTFTVVGVLPEDYRAITGWVEPELYVPISRLILSTIDERGSPSLSVMARLARGGTSAEAESAVTALGRSLEEIYPDRIQAAGRQASVFPAQTVQFRGTPANFFVVGGLLVASVGLVLVIACVNVTGLLMARAVHRRSEIAIRVALGAGRARVVQAMLLESLLLVLAGAVFGLLLVLAFGQVSLPGAWGFLQDRMAFDRRLLIYGSVVITVTTLLCGVIPALRATRGDLMTEVRQGGGGVTARLWLRHALVVGQIALSVTLIVLALLCVRSQIYVGSVNPGFDPDHGVVARFGFDDNQYPGEERLRFADRIVERIERIPGVSAVSLANLVPLGGDSLLRSFHPAGRTDLPGTRPSTYSVGPGYFQSLAVAFLRGHDFDASHRAGTPVVAIVNETFAKTHFPDQDVVGKRVQTAGEPEAEVIGLVRDNRIDTIGEAPQSVIYYPFAQRPRRMIVHVRTSGSPATMVSTVARAINEVDGSVAVSVQTLRAAASLELTMRRTGTELVGAIGIIGLLLTMIGLYGVMAYVVSSRTVEVAIRMALGASASRVRRDVLGEVLGLVAAGIVIGGAIALGLVPALRTFLVGVSPFDPLAFGTAAILLVIVGFAAGFIPAHRTSRIEPIRALRQQ